MPETTITLDDGRDLQVWVEGPPEGTPLVWHHGTPGSGLPYPPSVEEAASRGLRWVSYSRPGAGTSTRAEGRSVADCAADVAAIADRLGAERFYTGGRSGGGPHALACAAQMPDRVIAVVSIAACVPWGADGIDFLEGMGQDNLVEFGAALDGPEALRAWMDQHADATGDAATTEELIRSFGDLVSPVDRAALTGAFVEHLMANEHIALSEGYWGWFDDDLAFVRDWGFHLSDISVPVSIWQGGQDRFVPAAHGAWLAAHIPAARAHLLEEHGHLSLGLESFGEILDELLDSPATTG